MFFCSPPAWMLVCDVDTRRPNVFPDWGQHTFQIFFRGRSPGMRGWVEFNDDLHGFILLASTKHYVFVDILDILNIFDRTLTSNLHHLHPRGCIILWLRIRNSDGFLKRHQGFTKKHVITLWGLLHLCILGHSKATLGGVCLSTRFPVTLLRSCLKCRKSFEKLGCVEYSNQLNMDVTYWFQPVM